MRTLLDRGVRPTREAVSRAADQARPEMANLLIDRAEQDGWLTGCLGEVPDGDDPLAGALRASLLSLEIEMVRLLLERGADRSPRDAAGRDAADYVPDDDHDRALKLRLLRPAAASAR